MAKTIEPKLRKIGEYLKLSSNTNFVIPEYQRAYSWDTNNCDKLWQDIYNYVEENNSDSYFFGTVIISCEDDDTKYNLIDGQQRTTTFLLLLKALLMKINEIIPKIPQDEDSETILTSLRSRRRSIISILYQVDIDEVKQNPSEADKTYYQKPIVIENKSNNETNKDDLIAILQAVDYFTAEQNVKKYPRKQKDNKYTNFFKNFKFFYEKISDLGETILNKFAKSLIENCEVIEIKSWKVDQAIEMFNSLNSDGLPLYDSDILSAKLYSNAIKQNVDNEFNKLWKELKELTDDLREKNIVSLDSLLMQHMYYSRAYRKETVNAQGKTDVTTPGLRRYFTDINKDFLQNPIDVCKKLINLGKAWNKIYTYPCVQVLFKFSENFKLFLGTYLYRFNYEDITENDINELVLSFLKLFAVMEIVDSGYSSKNFKTYLFEKNIQLVDPNVPVSEIIADFNKHIDDCWNYDDILSGIKEYENNNLVFLNEFIFAKENNMQFDLNTSYDIEHIMPQSGKNKSEIQNDAGITSDEEFKEYINKLGNKIVLEQEINRGIQDEWFRSKISGKVSDKKGYVDSKYPIAKKLVEYYANSDNQHPYWTKEDITKQTDEASTRICKFIFGIV